MRVANGDASSGVIRCRMNGMTPAVWPGGSGCSDLQYDPGWGGGAFLL